MFNVCVGQQHQRHLYTELTQPHASRRLSPTAGFRLCSAGVAFGSQPGGHKTRVKQQMSQRGSLEDYPSGHPSKPQLLSQPDWGMCTLRLGLDPNLTPGCPVEVLFLQVAGKPWNCVSHKVTAGGACGVGEAGDPGSWRWSLADCSSQEWRHWPVGICGFLQSHWNLLFCRRSPRRPCRRSHLLQDLSCGSSNGPFFLFFCSAVTCSITSARTGSSTSASQTM